MANGCGIALVAAVQVGGSYEPRRRGHVIQSTIERNGPTPKPRAAMAPVGMRNGMKRRRAISTRRALRT